MLEILDIGNTFTRIAVWNGGEFCDLRRLSTEDLPSCKAQFPRIAACVCPNVKKHLSGENIRFISASENSGKIDFSMMDTSTLGADRAANAFAAAEFYKLPAVVIDCGTALTMEVIDSERRFVGGAISPGRLLMRKALASGTAQLPQTMISSAFSDEIGRNTADAIRFGVDCGAVGIIGRWLEVVRKKYPDITVVFSGGDGGFFAPHFREAELADEFFTLHGIRLAGDF